MLMVKSPVSFMEVSRSALEQNARTVVNSVGVPVIGVVKCDGYGISIPEAARAWQSAGVSMFAVSVPKEAVELRQAGVEEDILLMSPVADEAMLDQLLEQGIILTVSSLDNLKFYQNRENGRDLRVHVAIDTGMGRFGIRWTDREQLDEIYGQEQVRFEGVFSHFACSFEEKYSITGLQLERFLDVTSYLAQRGYPLGVRHMANSCAALRFPQTRLDAVRVGSALVGRVSAPVPVELVDAVRFKAQVVERRTLQPGDTTGYASVCRVKNATDVVVVAIGSQDGFGYVKAQDNMPLRLFAGWILRMLKRYKNSPGVFYGGKKLPLVGRVGNQFTLFNAAGTDIKPGDYVEAKVDLLFPGRNLEIR